MIKEGYKMTEIGEIPEEWICHTIGDPEISVNTKAGGTPLRSKKEYYENGNIPFVKIADIINSGKYLCNTAEKINENGIKNSSSWVTPPYSILFSMYASYGEVTINKVPVATNQAILSIIPNKSNIDLDYFYYQLKFLKPRLVKYLRYTTQNNLNAGVVNSLIIPVASLPEQQKIAEILSTAGDTIDNVNEQIILTEKLKKGLMQKLLTKGIGHNKFKMTEIGEMPEEWGIKKIKDISTYVTDGTHKTPHYIKDTEIGIPFISTENIKPYSNEFDFSRYKRHIDEISYKELSKRAKPEKGDLLISKCGTIGRTQLIRTDFKVGIFVGLLLVKINNNIINGHYLEELLNSDKFKIIMESKSTGSTRKTLAINVFKNITIPLPPLSEQQKIAEILLTVDKKLEILIKKKESLDKLKKWLMDNLLTGKIRVKINAK